MENIWQGKNVRLRAANKNDGFLFADERCNADTDCMRKYDYIDFPLSARQFGKKIDAFLNEESFGDDFMFVIENLEGCAVGLVICFDCDKRMGTFKYGLFLSDEHKGKGYGSEAVKIMLNYYFNELRYNKVNVYIYDFNDASIKFHEKLGFIFEGRLRQMAYTGGEYRDCLFYGMLRDEFNSANPPAKL